MYAHIDDSRDEDDYGHLQLGWQLSQHLDNGNAYCEPSRDRVDRFLLGDAVDLWGLGHINCVAFREDAGFRNAHGNRFVDYRR